MSMSSLGMDVCKVCGGDGTTCTDCAGTAGGKKVVDLCGACLEITDTNFNVGCSTKLGDFSPTIGYVEGNMPVEIKATNLSDKAAVTCWFVVGDVK